MPRGAMATGMDVSIRRLPEPVTVATLYRFACFEECEGMRALLQTICQEHGVRGTLLPAAEGINGTIAGSAEAVATVLIPKLDDCDSEGLPSWLLFDSRWQTDWSLPCLSRFVPISTPSR